MPAVCELVSLAPELLYNNVRKQLLTVVDKHQLFCANDNVWFEVSAGSPVRKS